MTGRCTRPALPDVTLVAVTSVAVGPTVDALLASMRHAEFGEVLLLSDREPPAIDDRITWRRIDRLASRADYSRFMLRGLVEHIATTHALCIQWDGFVLDGAAWNRSFLEYDYVGAPWPHFHDGHNVGNGGFSLRSRKLLDACRELPLDRDEAEDLVISRRCRGKLEEQGIRFAPESLARAFAFERGRRRGDEFGFHGAFNLVRLIPAPDAVRLFESLEAEMLARNELWELARWAVLNGRLNLARIILKRLAQRRGN